MSPPPPPQTKTGHGLKRAVSHPASSDDVPNWKYPGDTDDEDLSCTDKANDLDDSLTSLNWLHSMQGIKLDQPITSQKSNPKSANHMSGKTANQNRSSNQPATRSTNQGSSRSTNQRSPPKASGPKSPAVTPSRTRQQKTSQSPINSKPSNSSKPQSSAPTRPKCTFIHSSSSMIPSFGLKQSAFTRPAGSNQFVPALLSRHNMQNSADVSATSVFPLCGPGFDSDMYPMSFGCNKTSDAAQLLEDPDVAKYKYNHLIKPPFNFPTLICMAVKAQLASIDGQISLADIQHWIAHNFSYYKHADHQWQESIRQNLSENECFERVTPPAAAGGGGAGGIKLDGGNSFWRVAPAYRQEVEGMFKKRRHTPVVQTLATVHGGGLPNKKPRYAPGGVMAQAQSAPSGGGRSKRKQAVPDTLKRANSSPAHSSVAPSKRQPPTRQMTCAQYNEDAASFLESQSPLLSGNSRSPQSEQSPVVKSEFFEDDCYGATMLDDVSLMNGCDEEGLMSQIDDLFFDVSPPDSNCLSDEILSPSSRDFDEFLAIHGSRIDPPVSWGTKVKVEPLPDATTSWLECSQNSLNLSNNSDWLRNSHERIMAGGQLSDDDSGYAAGGYDGESPSNEVKLHTLQDFTNSAQFEEAETLGDLFDLNCLPEPLA